VDLSSHGQGWDQADSLLSFCTEALLDVGYVESQVFNLVLAALSLFWGDTLYPDFHWRYSKSSVSLRQFWQLVAMKRSFTYCKKVGPKSSVEQAQKSDTRAVLKILGEF
jgi:hypothetical protein